MELVKCGRCGVSLTPSIMFPGRFAAGDDFSFILAPRPSTRSHGLSPFRGVTRRWRPILVRSISDTGKNPLHKRPRSIFLSSLSPTGRRGEEGAAQLVLRRAHEPSPYDEYILRMAGECDGPGDRPPSSLLMQERVSFNNTLSKLGYSLKIRLRNKISRNITLFHFTDR